MLIIFSVTGKDYSRRGGSIYTRSEVEAKLKKEKEKALVSMISLDMKPPYSMEVVGKHY